MPFSWLPPEVTPPPSTRMGKRVWKLRVGTCNQGSRWVRTGSNFLTREMGQIDEIFGAGWFQMYRKTGPWTSPFVIAKPNTSNRNARKHPL